MDTKRENINTTAVLYKVSKSNCIAAKSQGFVELELVNQTNTIKSENMIFEPFNFSISLTGGCIAAKSVHSNLQSGKVFMNVLNATENEVKMKSGTVMGQAFEVEDELN